MTKYQTMPKMMPTAVTDQWMKKPKISGICSARSIHSAAGFFWKNAITTCASPMTVT